MNSYFASVEQQANPHLRGRPVGVCEHLGGLIIAPSVEAKRLGIKLGTPVWEALRTCPHIALLPTDPPKYRSVTEAFNRILADYTDCVERYSIDESFVDISECCAGDWNDALLIGLQIKQRLRREVGEWVSCSIGIGPNKLVAKIAADLDGGVIFHNSSPPPLILRGGVKIAPSLKVREGGPPRPTSERVEAGGEFLDRICVVRPQEVESLYDRLDLTDIPGIGKRLEHSLNRLGVFTLRQLRGYSPANLLNQFGIWGHVLRQLANFEDVAEVSSRPELPKSIGHMYTVPRKIGEARAIKGLMIKLCEKVGRRMRKQGARGGVVRYFDSNFGRQKTLAYHISDSREIYRVAWGIWKTGGHGRAPIKIMGITVSDLTFDRPPEPLFPEFKKPLWAVAASDRINDKYGEFTIYPGRLLGVPPACRSGRDEWGKDTVGFSRTKT